MDLPANVNDPATTTQDAGQAEWFHTRDGKPPTGPFTQAQLRGMAASGGLLPTDAVWKEGMAGWLPAAEVAGLLPGPAPAESPEVIEEIAGLEEIEEIKEIEEIEEIEVVQEVVQAPAAPGPWARVVGCPQCQSKLRVRRPGLVQCPRCRAKVRVGEALFS